MSCILKFLRHFEKECKSYIAQSKTEKGERKAPGKFGKSLFKQFFVTDLNIHYLSLTLNLLWAER